MHKQISENAFNQTQRPIGVFDSGIGGLTVLNALQQQLPNESFVYLGDTARLPYGIKSEKTIKYYAKQALDALIQYDIKLLVIACNTASAAALPFLKTQFPELPIVDVIESSAYAAAQATKNNRIAVLATEATTRSGLYEKTIIRHNPSAIILSQPCSLLVALAEEGLVDDPIAIAVLNKYLQPVIDTAEPCDTILLGCTHFPVFKKTIDQHITQGKTMILDSGHATARAVDVTLQNLCMKNNSSLSSSYTTRFLVTDLPERFSRIGRLFLQRPIPLQSIELIDLNKSAYADNLNTIIS